MKTAGKIESDIKKERHYKNVFSFYKDDFRIKQIQNQNFVVPWQMVDKENIAIAMK